MRKAKRILHLHRCLLRGYPLLNAEGWAAELKVDARTVLRDLKGIELEFGIKPIFDSHLKGYRYRQSDRQSFLERKCLMRPSPRNGDSLAAHLQGLAKYADSRVIEAGPHRIQVRVLDGAQEPLVRKLFQESRSLGADSVEVWVESPKDLVDWVLTQGGVQILAPPEMVQEVCQRASEILQRHGGFEEAKTADIRFSGFKSP